MKLVSDSHTNRIRTGPKSYDYVRPGTPFDCDDEVALEKIADGRARRATPRDLLDPTDAVEDDETEPGEGGDEVDADSVEAAILELDQDNPEHFGKDGRPSVKALGAILKVRVPAELRDAVWNEMQSRDGAAG